MGYFYVGFKIVELLRTMRKMVKFFTHILLGGLFLVEYSILLP